MTLQGPPNHDADQPPGFPGYESLWLPPSRDAAERLLAFVSWFGDGQVIEHPRPGEPPLFARDLEAVAKAVLHR
jgi:hypothetical protein